jgi:hypothetical protein
MGGFYSPIDFSGMVGYPHDISEDVIKKMSEFHDYDDASAHIRDFGRCIDEWCDPPIYEDVLMELFVMNLILGYACDWFHDSKDNMFKTIWDFLHAFLEIFGDDWDKNYSELVDGFMEKWKRKNLPDIKTVNSNIRIDTPPDPIKELEEITQTMLFSHTDQLEAMETPFAEDETCIEYPDPIELELHNEKDRELHREIPYESMDDPVNNIEEVKEFEFEVVDYLDHSSPHPPPEEPISSRENFDNLDENNAVVSLTCSFSTSQPKDDLI